MIYGFGWRRPRRDKNRNERKKFPDQRFKRVGVEVQVIESQEIFSGRLFLTDLSPNSMSFFVDAPLERGEEVAIVLEHPRRLYVRGTVQFCGLRTLNMRVISAQDFGYRAYVKFDFDSRQEEDALKIFCSELPA